MSQVYNNYDTKNSAVSSPQIKQLEQLENDLSVKLADRQAVLTQTGLINDIKIDNDPEVKTINQALGKVREARAQIDPNYGIDSNSKSEEISQQANINVDNINAREAAQIKAIRSVAGQALNYGQKFASLDGRQPSYNSYMQDNINGLFALTALKASF